MLFNNIYVLAKGGVTIFYGCPQILRQHLIDCDINLSEHQIPIEILMKIGANGCMDETVIRLSNKTNENLKCFEKRIEKELKLFPNGIPFHIKRFSFKELNQLFKRSVVYNFKHNWIIITALISAYIGFSYFMRLVFDFDIERPEGCIDINTTIGCIITKQQLEDSKLLQYNLNYLFVGLSVPLFLTLLSIPFIIGPEIKLVVNENKNCMHFSKLPIYF
jgi:hypothetical protein